MPAEKDRRRPGNLRRQAGVAEQDYELRARHEPSQRGA